MSDLSRALVDAAAEQFDHGEQWRDVYVDPELRGPFIRACVAAVLETLAAHVSGQHPIELVDLVGYGKAYNEGKSYVVGLMQRTAAEVRDVR